LFSWCLGVPGTFVQIIGWFFLVVSIGEASKGSTKSGLVLAAGVLLSLVVFLIGRLMSLASDFLTGILTLPENKKPLAISLAYQISVQLLLAGIFSQAVVFLSSAARQDHAGMLRSGSVCAIFTCGAIVTQICSDRFRRGYNTNARSLGLHHRTRAERNATDREPRNLLALVFLGLPGLLMWIGGLIYITGTIMSLTTGNPVSETTALVPNLVALTITCVGMLMISNCEIMVKGPNLGIPLKRVPQMMGIALGAQLLLILACRLVVSGLQMSGVDQWIRAAPGCVAFAASIWLHQQAFVRRKAWRKEYSMLHSPEPGP